MWLLLDHQRVTFFYSNMYNGGFGTYLAAQTSDQILSVS